MNKLTAFLIILILAFITYIFFLGIEWIDVLEKYLKNTTEDDKEPCEKSIYSSECDYVDYCQKNRSNKQCQSLCRDFPSNDACKIIEDCILEPWTDKCILSTCESLGLPEEEIKCEEYCNRKENLVYDYCKDYFCRYNENDPLCFEDYCDIFPEEAFCICKNPSSEDCEKFCDKNPENITCEENYCIRNPLESVCVNCGISDIYCNIKTFENKVFKIKNNTTKEYLSCNVKTPPGREKLGKIWLARPDQRITVNQIADKWYLHKTKDGKYYLCNITDKNFKIFRSLETGNKLILSYNSDGVKFNAASTGKKNTFYFINEQNRALTLEASSLVTLYGITNSRRGQEWSLEVLENETLPSWENDLTDQLILGKTYYFTATPTIKPTFLNPFDCTLKQVSNVFSSNSNTTYIKINRIYNAANDSATNAVILGYEGVTEKGVIINFSMYLNNEYVFLTSPLTGGENKAYFGDTRSKMYYSSCEEITLNSVNSAKYEYNAMPFRISETLPYIDPYLSSCINEISKNSDNFSIPSQCDKYSSMRPSGLYKILDVWSGRYVTNTSIIDFTPYLKIEDFLDVNSQLFDIISNEGDFDPNKPETFIIARNLKTKLFLDFNGSSKNFVDKTIENVMKRNRICINIGRYTTTDIYSENPKVIQNISGEGGETLFMLIPYDSK